MSAHTTYCATWHPCQLHARKGSIYCRYHDPELRDQVVDVVERARAELA